MSRIGANPTLRTTAADFELLDKHTDEDGRVWQYTQANGAILANAYVLMTEAGQAFQVTTTTTATAFGDSIAVATAAFADNEYGWVARFGTGTDIAVLVAANCAANVALNSTGTDGTLDDDATSGAEVIDGIVIITANGGSTAAVQAELNWPTVGATIA